MYNLRSLWKTKSVLLTIFKLFEFIKHVKGNILVKSKKFTLLDNVTAGPPRRMISGPKLRRDVTARYDGVQRHNFGDRSVVAMRPSDGIEFRVGVGWTERVEPLDTCMVSREISATQVIRECKNKADLSNAEPY